MSRHCDGLYVGRMALGTGARKLRRAALCTVMALSAVPGSTLSALEYATFPAGDQQGARSNAKGAAVRQAPVTMELVVAATTDVHGWLRGWNYDANRPDSTRGLARVATIMDSVRAANPSRVLLLDAGDLLQGTPFNYAAAKVAPQSVHPVIAAMNLLRYDAAVVGNHEFDYGVPFLEGAVRQAKFPFLAANVRNSNGTPHFKAATTVMRNGARIAVIGATTTGARSWSGEYLAAARLTVTDIIPEVRTAVLNARAAGADVVIVLLHSGLGRPPTAAGAASDLGGENVADRIPREVPGIDLVVFGHTHNHVVDSTINGVMLMQPRHWATSVNFATLKLEKNDGKWRVARSTGSSVAAAGHPESKSLLALTERSHVAAVRWVNAPIGQTVARWRSDSARVQDSPIIDFVAEVMRREAGSDLAAVAAFSLAARLDSGAITTARISELYPYDNTLRAVRISGKQLRAFMEYSAEYYRTLTPAGAAPEGGVVNTAMWGYNFDIVSGVDYVIDLRKPVGARVTGLSFRGKLVADDDSFTMATNNYRLGGGGGYTMMSGLPVTYAKDVEIRQLLIDEVKRAGTVRAERYHTVNWKLEPASAVAMAYAEQNAVRAAPVAPRAQPTARTLRVLTTSDIHAALEGRKDERGRVRGGVVALHAALTNARRECSGLCTSITIDAGDLFSGSPASDWAAGKPTVAALNRLGISAGALGNHEFDFGQDTLRMRLAELNYRVLGANVVGPDGKVPGWIKADTIVVRDGLRIGIVGAASQFTPSNTKRRFLQGLRFLDAAPIVSARITALRAQNVDAVIVTIHEGARCKAGLSDDCEGSGIEFVKKLTEKPDAVVLGHAHTNMVLTINGIPAVQVSNNGRGMGVIDIPLAARNTATAGVRDVIGDSLVLDPVLDTIVKNAVRRVWSRQEQPVATIKETMERRGEQYPLGNLVADAMRIMGNGDFGAWNNGGIRTDLRAGPLNFGGVHELTPFGNSLAKLSIRGRDLRTLLESVVRGRNPDTHISGLRIEYDASKQPGQRITSLKTTDGRELEPNRIYSLIVNDFMADDPDFSRPDLLVSSQILPIVDAPAIAEYLKRLPQPVVGPPEVRIRHAGGMQ
ncbi:MAG: 5'-nucleotidase C-terminal domain-containing protein [Phycisphaerae bacterium]|nr:5'-nucleotidase C-terminal domain-containing protein [Gemmatimonadaceae bacterium]